MSFRHKSPDAPLETSNEYTHKYINTTDTVPINQTKGTAPDQQELMKTQVNLKRRHDSWDGAAKNNVKKTEL